MSNQEHTSEEKYFDNIPNWPNSEIMADKFSGRIPVTKISSWQDFSNLLDDKFFNRHKDVLIYRGHRRYDWTLTPTLGRLDQAGIIHKVLAEKQIGLFKLAIRGRTADHSLVLDDQEDELWSVGQLHGLITPLLDWTYSPYVALFFAFENPDEEHELNNPYRAIYVLNKSFIENDAICPELRIIEPKKDTYGRLVNQAGVLTFSPYGISIENYIINTLAEDERIELDLDNPNEFAQYICKIYVANENRDGCIRHLRRMNVHHASLFPDLLGAAQYCNLLIDEQNLILQDELADKIFEEMLEHAASQDKQTEEIEASKSDIKSLLNIISQPNETKQVEKSRLNLIAQSLESELKKYKYIDWDKRESTKAKMRNAARTILRNYGYPADIRDKVVDQILEAEISRSQN